MMQSLVDRLEDNDPQLTQLNLKSLHGLSADRFIRALRKNTAVKSLQICDECFNIPGYQSPTLRGLKSLLQSVPHMQCLEELTLQGSMELENMHDVKVIAQAVKDHPRLRIVRLLDFVVYAPDHRDSAPLLDGLLKSAVSMPKLEALDIKCYMSHKFWARSYISQDLLLPICRSSSIKRLSLSNLGLNDAHFWTISQELLSLKESTPMQELILNDNNVTNSGLEAMIQLLETNRSLQRLDMNNHNMVAETTSEEILHALKKNRVIKSLSVNAHYIYRTKIFFYLKLNRAGREKLLNPNVMPTDVVDVLAAANGNVSVLMHFLQEKPCLCQSTAVRKTVPPVTSGRLIF